MSDDTNYRQPAAMAEVSRSGDVRINWNLVENYAEDEGDPVNCGIARILLAVRDGTYKDVTPMAGGTTRGGELSAMIEQSIRDGLEWSGLTKTDEEVAAMISAGAQLIQKGSPKVRAASAQQTIAIKVVKDKGIQIELPHLNYRGVVAWEGALGLYQDLKAAVEAMTRDQYIDEFIERCGFPVERIPGGFSAGGWAHHALPCGEVSEGWAMVRDSNAGAYLLDNAPEGFTLDGYEELLIQAVIDYAKTQPFGGDGPGDRLFRMVPDRYQWHDPTHLLEMFSLWRDLHEGSGAVGA